MGVSLWVLFMCSAASDASSLPACLMQGYMEICVSWRRQR